MLSCVVKYYTDYGEPVGSKLIADEMGVSSATVRNVMAELTEQGLLEQPHTSAGRIPSPLGYREYLNSSLEDLPVNREEKLYFDSLLSSGAPDMENLLSKAATALASRHICAVTTPGGADAKIKAVQFVQLSRRTGMLILLSSAGTMKNRLFQCEFDLSPEIMRIFFRVFNEKVAGRSVAEITPAFVQSLAVSFGELSMLMTSALLSLFEASEETLRSDVVVKGQMNLLLQREFHPTSLRQMLELTQSQDEMRNLLTGRQGRLNVALGAETGCTALRDAGLVTAKYMVDGQDAGVFAVIGPMRMDYPKVISHLKYVSDYVGRTLTDFMREEL